MATAAKTVRTPRLSRSDQKAKRTEQLLEAAWTIFCEKGYEGTTIDAVAEHAGVSRFPVFYAFGDKQNLFFELWKKRVGTALNTIESRVKKGVSLRANLEALAEWVVKEHASNPYGVDGLFFVVQTIGLSRADITEKLQAVATDIIDHITGVIESSSLEPGQQLRRPARTVATHVVAYVNGLANMRSRVHRVPLDAGDLVESFLTITTRHAASPSRRGRR
jgi:AcrR family transcriptional regulator